MNDAARCWALHSWYWPRYDLIAQQSLLVTKHVIDTSGPAGRAQANRHLQTMLNNFNDPVETDAGEVNRYGDDLKVDGIMGWKTSQRMDEFLNHRQLKGECLLAFACNCFQLRHFSKTAEVNEGKRDYTFGWWWNRCFTDCPEIFEHYERNKDKPYTRIRATYTHV